MTKKSIVLYLAVIGLLLIAVISWYIYALRSQPEPVSVSFDRLPAYANISDTSLEIAGDTLSRWITQ
jgi:hypothetical protein